MRLKNKPPGFVTGRFLVDCALRELHLLHALVAHAATRAGRLQPQAGYRGAHIEAAFAFHAHWLQCERVRQTTDQSVSARTDADRGAGGGADVTAFERARAYSAAEREHGPHQRDVVAPAGFGAGTVDHRGVVLRA